MAAVVGFAFWGLAVTPVGKQVFLLLVAVTPNAMHGMTTTATTVQKAAVGRKKRPPLAVKKSSLCSSIYMTIPIDNKVIIFLYRRSRTFFTAKGGLFAFAAFQPATRQARLGVAGNIREPALEIFTVTHGRIGRSPEKPQIFLYLFVVVYSRIKENTLQVTPTAKRNSYRVAILVGRLPRVASFARNPGLGRRNSFRVARSAHRPRWDSHTWL